MQIPLTPKQQESIAPLIAKADEAHDNGQKGIVVAQVYSDHMIMGFLPHDKAKLLEKEADPV